MAKSTAEATQRVELTLGLDPFGDDGGTECIETEGKHGRPQGPTGRVVVDAPREPDVELDDVGAEIEDVAEARKSGAGVVDGESHPVGSQLAGSLSEPLVVVDALMLGQLEHNALGRGLGHGARNSSGHHGVR